MQANECAGSNSLVMRRTYPELEESILKQFRLHIPWREYGARFNESKHIVTLANKATIRFGYAANEQDIFNYQGGEYLYVGIDELTLFTLSQWQFLTTRNRCPIPTYTSGPNFGNPVFACMAGASNPGNIGHEWVKALFIEKRPAPGMENPEKYDASEYAYIPALVSDNPIYAHDEAYLKVLDALPAHMRAAFLLGDWDIFVGQYYSNFDRQKHLATPEVVRKVLKPWSRRWMSIDWGHAHNAAVYWHAREGDLVITYREIVQSKLAPTILAQSIVDKMPRDEKTGKFTEHLDYIFLSNETFRPNSWGEHSIPEMMGEVFKENGLPQPAECDNDRIGGAMLMYDLLEKQNWIISTNCPRLIANIPSMTRDPDNPEDVLKCLVAGTLIETLRGSIPIESITTYDFVWTRAGWKRVQWARQTGAQLPVFRLALADGRTLTGTAEHPVLTENGWKALLKLDGDDMIPAWRLSPSEAFGFIAAQAGPTSFLTRATLCAAWRAFTGKYGRRIADQFRRITTSTTRTATPEITGSAIWNAFRRTSICEWAYGLLRDGSSARLCLAFSGAAAGAGSFAASSAARPSCLASPTRQAGSTVPAIAPINAAKKPSALSAFVRRALLALGSSRTQSRNIHDSARSAVSTLEPAGLADVFNLGVKDQPEFLANGVLVHNCDGDDPYDSARYGLKTYLSPRRKPLSEEVRQRVDAMNIPSEARTTRMMMEAKVTADLKKKAAPRRFFGPRRHR